MKKFSNILIQLINALNVVALISVAVFAVMGIFLFGYFAGYNSAATESQSAIESLLASLELQVSSQEGDDPEASPNIVYVRENPVYTAPNWSGPDLWEAVNGRRKQLGVNAMSSQAELCTIASIRLNELLDLGKLDGHEGFSTLPDRRPDLKWIFEKYNISEFLVSGATTATEAVQLWENTLGHKKLLTGGEYVWGCTYAQNGFGVAIAAY